MSDKKTKSANALRGIASLMGLKVTEKAIDIASDYFALPDPLPNETAEEYQARPEVIAYYEKRGES